MNATLRAKHTPHNPAQWKFIDGMLDILPYDECDEAWLQQWLGVFGDGLRQFYDLPAVGGQYQEEAPK